MHSRRPVCLTSSVSESDATRRHVGLNLPKRCLARAGRAEDLSDFPAHEPAGDDDVSREALGGEESVELREAGRHSARAPRMEVVEGLRGGYSG